MAPADFGESSPRRGVGGQHDDNNNNKADLTPKCHANFVVLCLKKPRKMETKYLHNVKMIQHNLRLCTVPTKF